MGEGAHPGTAVGQTGRTCRRSGLLEFGRLELCQWTDDLCRRRNDFGSLSGRLAMLAVRKTARGVGNVEVQDMPEPHPNPGQVLMEVDSAGICGTDLHLTPASNLHRVPDELDLESAAL